MTSFDEDMVKWFFTDDVGVISSVIQEVIGNLSSDKDFLFNGDSFLLKRNKGHLTLYAIFTKKETELDTQYLLSVAVQWQNFAKSLLQH
jgi:hypothetical protein